MRPYGCGLVAILLAFVSSTAPAAPPFSGTIFLDPDIITDGDPSTFVSLADAGQGLRTMFDRRFNAFVQRDAYLFVATYADGLQIEFQVNPEFGSAAVARAEAALYAPVVGRLPRALRADVETSWIHRGDHPFGGGNRNLLIHTGSIAQGYIADGILEETFVHEAAHTSLDAAHAAAPGWIAAQQADAEFISTYARDNPTTEDVAESVLPWLAVSCARQRLQASVAATIQGTIPNRLAYFDAVISDLAPVDCNPERIFRHGFEG